MIGGFQILGHEMVCHINEANYAIPVEAIRVHEPGGEVEATDHLVVEVFPATKQSVDLDRKRFYRVLQLGVAMRAPGGDLSNERFDEITYVFDQVEGQLLSLNNRFEERDIKAVFRGINVGEERQAYLIDLLKQYDQYADVMIANFDAYYDYAT